MARRLQLRHAVVLGLLQGPTELLPVSSSAHTTLIAELAGWPYAELEDELRKSFEVALHAGAGLALAIELRGELLDAARRLDGTQAAVIALSLAPAALAGLALERPIERRLGRPRPIALGLLAGAIAMALADSRAPSAGRRREQARPCDGLALGLAQALALAPGVSRNGATLTAARARGFARRDAHALSWQVALPVIFGASALKCLRMGRSQPAWDSRAAIAAGAAAAFVSTRASARALRRSGLERRPLLPFALYRCLLAGAVLRRSRMRAQ